jgi:hypothetical protein
VKTPTPTLLERQEETERLKYVLWSIVANTEPNAVQRIGYDGKTDYEVLAADISDYAKAAIGDWVPPQLRDAIQGNSNERD